jgi:APA family basic amino acid/polyamine antiporter
VEKLKRELNLFDITLAGVGIIIGAGIYALLGIATQTSGNALWLSFLISAIIAILTGLSYAELSSMFKKDAGEYNYIEYAFNKKLALILGIMIIISGAFSLTTVSLGFSNYFRELFNLNSILIAIILVLICSIINYLSIKEVSKINIFVTILQVIGLFIIIFLGFKFIGNTNYTLMPSGFNGILQSSALIFFAFIGFEGIVKLEEETKDPHKTIPKAIVLSVLITSIIYILVAIAAVSIIPWQELSKSNTPLADIAYKELGNNGLLILTIIALIATASTVLVSLAVISRMIYGMAEEKCIPGKFCLIDKKRKTPYIAIFSISLFVILLIFIRDIKIVANITNIFLFLTFALVNLSLIVLRYKKPYIERRFRISLNIGKFNIPSFFGFLTSLILLYYALLNVI